jgi:sec-independent protein translocase protein TatA
MIALLQISGVEWIWVILGIGLLFGASRVPTLMRGLGQGVKEFKTAMKDDEPASAPAAPKTNGPGVNPTTSDEQPS